MFPNTFEYFFIAYEAVRTRWNPARLSVLAVVTMAVFITVFIKLPQEWWIHIAQLDFTDFMADHPYLWFVLAGLVVAAGVVYWRYRSRLPATDWAFTVDVDRHLPELPAAPTVPERFWSAVLLEKVVLLALISVIFAQVLPDVRASNLGVAIGVALLVVLNASVTQFVVRRRGRSWSSSAQEFAAMLVINTGIVTRRFGSRPRRRGTSAEHVVLRPPAVIADRAVRPVPSDARTRRRPDAADRHRPGPMAIPIPCLNQYRPPTAPPRADGSTNFLVRSVGASSCAPRSGSARCRWRCSPPMQ